MKEFLTFDNLDLQVSQIIEELVKGSDDLFKCLKYPSRDALSKTITLQDKLELIDNEEDKYTRVYKYLYAGNRVEGEAQTQLRIDVTDISPLNAHNAQIQVTIQVMMHTSLIQMDNKKTRMNVIFKEILNVLGKDKIISVKDTNGGASFQMKFATGNRRVTRYFNEEYYGYTFTMTYEGN